MTQTLSNRTLWAMLAALIGLRVVFMFGAGPFPDEAYYWFWGQNLDWSYFDHPPLQAWFQRVIFELFGASLFALRLPALISTLVIVYVLACMANRFRLQLLPLIVVTFATPTIFIFTAMSFNDHLMVALLFVAAYQVVVLQQALADKTLPLARLYGLALCIGLAGLTKFNAAFFAIALMLMVVGYRDYRWLLARFHFWIALSVAALCLFPLAYWNLSHDAASFAYNFQDRHTGNRDPQAVLMRAGTLLGLIFVTYSPILVLGIFARGKTVPAHLRRLAVWVFVTTVIGCVAVSTSTFVLYYWAIPAVIPALLYIGAHLRPLGQILHGIFGAVIAGLFTVNSALVPLSALTGTPDRETGLLYDSDKLAAMVATVAAQTPGASIIASDYRHGAILGFRLSDKNVSVLSSRRSQFTLLNAWEPDRVTAPAVIVTSDWHPMSSAITEQFPQARRIGYFTASAGARAVMRYEIYLAE